MYQTIPQLQDHVRKLSKEGLAVVDAKTLTHGQKMGRLERIEADIKKATDEIENLEFVQKQQGAFHRATDPQAFAGGYGSLDPGATHMTAFTGTAASKAAAPTVHLDDQELEQLFYAGKSKSRARIELKATTGLVAPPVLLPGVQPFRQESTRIASILPSTASPAPSVEFLRHTGNAGTVTVVAAGAVKPDVSPSFETVTISAIKVAGLCKVQDEMFQDFSSFAGLITGILQDSYESAENLQLLLGTGAANGQMSGLLLDADVLTRTRGTDSALDALELAGEDLRIGPAFCEPTAYLLHPSTYGIIRRSKDLQGRYLLSQDPSSIGPSSLWGRPVILTTQMPVGTGVALNTELAAMVFVRSGITIDTSNAPGFETNETSFRIEARLNLGVIRPKAICIVTGLDAA